MSTEYFESEGRVMYSDLSNEDFLNSLTQTLVPDPLTLMIGYEWDMVRKTALRPQADQSRVYIYGIKQADLDEASKGDMRFKALGFMRAISFPLPPSSLIINYRKLSLLDASIVKKALNQTEPGTTILVVTEDLDICVRLMTARQKIDLRHILSNGSLYAGLGIVSAPKKEETTSW